MNQVAGLAGWQWLFLIEGAPAAVLGVIALFYLTDRPDQANWLTADERSWLSGKIADEEKHREQQHGLNLGKTVMDGRVWRLILLYLTIAGGIAGLAFYLPTFIKDRFPGRQEFAIGLLTAVVGLGAIVAMVLVSISSDRMGERRWHVAGCAAFGAVGWGLYALLDGPLPSLLALTLAQAALLSALAPFWALPASFLSGRAAAGGIALINAFGNLGGFAAPYLLARLHVPGGTYVWGILAMVMLLIIGAALAVSVRREPDHRVGM
jgi:ACS family tartrate transporter-like MFS transporter